MSVATIGEVVAAYQTERVSGYHELRHGTRVRHGQVLRRIVARHGDVLLSDIKSKTIMEWHLDWSDNKTKIATGHSFIAQLRTLCRYGVLAHEDPECVRLATVLSMLRFPNAKRGKEKLTFEQADAICRMAHRFALPSIALTEATQFECGFRQKDLIGEIVPTSEPGPGLPWRDRKWMRGIVWPEIDQDLVLRHVTSKTQKPVVFDLKTRPLVMRELNYLAHISPGKKSGALVKCEITGLPWVAGEFRRKWREIADACGIPKSVCNMHSRSGMITETINSGVAIENASKLATHSNVETTEIYNRGDFEEIDAKAMQARLAHRAARATPQPARAA